MILLVRLYYSNLKIKGNKMKNNYITGIIKEIGSNYVVLENNGIGYQIFVGNPYVYRENLEYTIYLYNYIREDEYTLYGFKKKEEKYEDLAFRIRGFSKFFNMMNSSPRDVWARMPSRATRRPSIETQYTTSPSKDHRTTESLRSIVSTAKYVLPSTMSSRNCCGLIQSSQRPSNDV